VLLQYADSGTIYMLYAFAFIILFTDTITCIKLNYAKKIDKTKDTVIYINITLTLTTHVTVINYQANPNSKINSK